MAEEENIQPPQPTRGEAEAPASPSLEPAQVSARSADTTVRMYDPSDATTETYVSSASNNDSLSLLSPFRGYPEYIYTPPQPTYGEPAVEPDRPAAPQIRNDLEADNDAYNRATVPLVTPSPSSHRTVRFESPGPSITTSNNSIPTLVPLDDPSMAPILHRIPGILHPSQECTDASSHRPARGLVASPGHSRPIGVIGSTSTSTHQIYSDKEQNEDDRRTQCR